MILTTINPGSGLGDVHRAPQYTGKAVKMSNAMITTPPTVILRYKLRAAAISVVLSKKFAVATEESDISASVVPADATSGVVSKEFAVGLDGPVTFATAVSAEIIDSRGEAGELMSMRVERLNQVDLESKVGLIYFLVQE